MNQSLNHAVSKICAETSLTWPDALPVTSMHRRQRPNQRALTPAEVSFGRNLQILNAYITTKTNLLEGAERLTQCGGDPEEDKIFPTPSSATATSALRRENAPL